MERLSKLFRQLHRKIRIWWLERQARQEISHLSALAEALEGVKGVPEFQRIYNLLLEEGKKGGDRFTEIDQELNRLYAEVHNERSNG